ncbi:hypothetical protein [Escherichia coli]|nr:hypothetical protein [Escherichia coli]
MGKEGLREKLTGVVGVGLGGEGKGREGGGKRVKKWGKGIGGRGGS